MLISRVSDNVSEGAGEAREDGANSHEYQTANELFEFMAKNHNFDPVSEGDALTARDLVILYKNIDIGTKLMSNANELKRKKPNQHVETVVHDEDADTDGSDISEIYSYEDLHDVVMINKERIDILTNHSSFENTLCHKLGDLEIQSSDLTTEYDRQFTFKDPYIKEQLKNFNLKYSSANEIGESILPASLLDYICCKRLEDNYNFYMDNIIMYVKHTIDHLKRISNGDYLTEKAKEKWKEVENKVAEHIENGTKVLATSTSIPLHVERKVGGHASTWDDLVHSEVDIRSLSKILEKKIIVEVPKLLCGSYTLFSKRCADNLIISCKREKEPENKYQTKKGESRVDVVLQLQRSQSGQVISNINSIMILKTATNVQRGMSASKLLPLPYNESMVMMKEKKVEIVELEPETPDVAIETYEDTTHQTAPIDEINQGQPNGDAATDNSDYPCSENDCSALSENLSNPELNASGQSLRDIIDMKGQNVHSEASFNILSPDELRIRMQRLNTQTTVPEESEDPINTINKKKSLTRVRIKSPYENQSIIMEEKKRKKLLEIREKREKKKIALSETCKVSKHKYSKGAIMPQPSSSVTKLSITNKSFYNSIYGQSMNIDNNQQRRKGQKKDFAPDTGIERTDDEIDTPLLTPDKNSKKYTKPSYYLDEADTEMMYMEMKQNENRDKESSTSTSAVSNDFQANFSLLSQLIGASSTDISKNPNSLIPSSSKSDRSHQVISTGIIKEFGNTELTSSQSILNVVPMNSPKDQQLVDIKNEPKKSTSSIECRKSIDKIYGLMNKLGKSDANSEHKLKIITVTTEKHAVNDPQGASTVQGSDSGTSLKHHLTSSNPSCFSFEQPIPAEAPNHKNSANKKPDVPGTVVPKVIISSKVNVNTKTDVEKNKKERKKAMTSPTKIPDNPLKAISQLLHEFESVQKNRHKQNADPKQPKKFDGASNETRSGIIRQSAYKRRSRLEQHLRDHPPIEKSQKPLAKERKTRQGLVIEVPKCPHRQIPVEDKHERFVKKKIADILDEAKEARGEAVRGPPKLNRLNSLAQPKRSYVQAHSEEYQTRYGKNLMADRLQRLAAAPATAVERPTLTLSARNKSKRSYVEPAPPPAARQPPTSVSTLEKLSRSRRANSTSPNTPAMSPAVLPSHKESTAVDLSPPETLKKNMVESYVKSHYGRETPSVAPGNLLQSVAKARVPLFPTDLDLISTSSSPIVEESTELGSKLHFIINTIINTKQPSLTVLTECQEINSKQSQESMNDDIHCPDNSSSSSAAHVDIFEDKNLITAVANDAQKCLKLEDEANGTIPEQGTSVNNEVLAYNSNTEIEKLENALYRKISVGTFQNRLRIKKLTLTPKQSMQQVFLLQSGDAGSMLLKSSISQIKINKEPTDKVTDFKVYPARSNTHVSWNISNLPMKTNIPMQITTVGYAFPQYDSGQCNLASKVSPALREKSEDTALLCNKIDKVSQCFKGEHADVRSDHGIQADIEDNITGKRESPDSVKTDIIPINASNSEPVDIEETNDEHKEESSEKANRRGNETSDSQFTQTNEIEVDNVKREETVILNKNPEGVSYTSSLDVLVGLLNEIQKITTCQTHISQTDDEQCRELEYILKDAAVLEQKVDKDKTPDLVSMSSLEKLRQLESTPSIYSFYLSNDGDRNFVNNRVNNGNDVMSVKEPSHNKPICADKEVSVDCVDREFMNRFTDAPSQFFPITVSHGTNVTNSLIGVISEPSSESTMYSFTDLHETIYGNPLNVCKKISEWSTDLKLELPHEVVTADASCALIPEVKLESYVKQICNDTLPLLNVDKDRTPRKIISWNNKISKGNLVVKSSEFDPVIKIKRDMLVTLYSILVFTVFAALSFPEMLYY